MTRATGSQKSSNPTSRRSAMPMTPVGAALLYDAASRLTKAQDPTGTYTFTYDNKDRLTNSSTVYASLPAKTFSVSQAYDAGSNRTSLTDPNNGTISYTYDVLNRLTTLKD